MARDIGTVPLLGLAGTAITNCIMLGKDIGYVTSSDPPAGIALIAVVCRITPLGSLQNPLAPLNELAKKLISGIWLIEEPIARLAASPKPTFKPNFNGYHPTAKTSNPPYPPTVIVVLVEPV